MADGSQLDENLFEVQLLRSTKNKFVVKQTKDAAAVGEYKITYRAFFKKFPYAYYTQEKPFTITITDQVIDVPVEVPEIEIFARD